MFTGTGVPYVVPSKVCFTNVPSLQCGVQVAVEHERAADGVPVASTGSTTESAPAFEPSYDRLRTGCAGRGVGSVPTISTALIIG